MAWPGQRERCRGQASGFQSMFLRAPRTPRGASEASRSGGAGTNCPVCLGLKGLPFFKKRTYVWLRWVFVALSGLSLVAASGGHCLVAVRGFLMAVPSLTAEHGLRGEQAS